MVRIAQRWVGSRSGWAWGAALSIVATLSAAPLAAAEPDSRTRSAARSLGTSGVEAYQAGDYTGASDKLERAYAALKVPSLGLWSARALIKLNHWVEASERLVEVSRLEVSGGDAAVQKSAKAEAEIELNALSPRIPSLVVELKGAAPADANVTIDDRALAAPLIGTNVPVDPGSHTIRAQLGEQRAEERIALKEGESKRVALTLAPASSESAKTATSALSAAANTTPPINDGAAEPSHTRRNLALGAAALGVVGVSVGTVFYFKASNEADEARSICPSSMNCKDEEIARHAKLDDDVKSDRTVAYVGWGVGGAFLLGSALIYFTGSDDSTHAQSSRFTVGFAPLPGGYFGSLKGSFQ